MKALAAISCLLLLATFSLANAQPTLPVDTFTFGTYAGECKGKCIVLYKLDLTKQTLAENRSAQPSNFNTGQYILRSNLDFQRVMFLRQLFPAQLLANADTSFGQPDAYDQGGYYVELRQNGQIHTWTIDTNKQAIPNYLRTFTDSLFVCVQALHRSQISHH